MQSNPRKLTFLWTTNSLNRIKQWLEKQKDERDYTVGALYLLKLSGNQMIVYKNIITQIYRRHDFVEYLLQKYYSFRVQAMPHAQV